MAAISSVSNATLVVTAPAHVAGFVDVRVTTRGGAALVASAYEYYSGVASLTAQVYNAKTLTPLANAHVAVSPGGLNATTGADGQAVFPRVRPRSYTATVSAANYTQVARAFSVVANAQAVESFFLTPDKETPQACGGLFGQLNQSTKEMAVPASADDIAGAVVPSDGPLALRLTSATAVAPASVWAQVVDVDGQPIEASVSWRASVLGNDTDGWVVVRPVKPLTANATISVTVGATNADGSALESVTRRFLVAADAKQAGGSEPTLTAETTVTALPAVLAGAQSTVYRIAPSRVFDAPVAIRIPVAGGVDAAKLEVYYFSESGAQPGWYRGQNVEGWLAAAPQAIEENGQAYVEVLVNHAGVVQLAQAALPVQGSAGATRSAWMTLAAALLTLSLVLGGLARRGRARG